MGGRLSLTLFVALIAVALPGAGPGEARAETVDVRIDPARLGPLIDKRFLGLSFEADALPQVARSATRGNLVRLLRSLGPGTMRFGGNSVDTTTAFSRTGVLPAWAGTAITPGDLNRLRKLADLTGWRIRLALNLGRYDPEVAAREAAVAMRSLGPALAAIEIGNEPNAYPFLGLRPPAWGYIDYRRELRAYRRAISEAAPDVRVAGPDSTTAPHGFRWLAAFAREEQPALLTPHYYPLNVCFQPAPDIRDLLSPAQATEDAQTLTRFARIGRRYGIKVRVGETNNVGCRGRPGLSDTFAASLWALRYMIAMARANIAGVNFHTLIDDCRTYTPICATSGAAYRRGRLRVMPEWYALVLFRHVLGSRLAALSSSRRPPGLSLEAFRRSADGVIDLMAVNTGSGRDLTLSIRVVGPDVLRAADMIHLTAPVVSSTTGVRIGGRRVGRGGAPRPGRAPRPIRLRSGRLRVGVPGGSAILLRMGPPAAISSAWVGSPSGQ